MKTNINESVVTLRSQRLKLSGYRFEKGRAIVQKQIDKISSYSKVDSIAMFDRFAPLTPPLPMQKPVKTVVLIGRLFNKLQRYIPRVN